MHAIRTRAGTLPALIALPAALCAALLITPPAVAGTLEVAWVQPERFADAGRGTYDRERTLEQLAHEFSRLGRVLPEGQTLRLEVTELDMAGEIEPAGWHSWRVLRQRADWPRMTVRYTLLDDGRTVKAGEAQLSDIGYGPSRALGASDGPEARMLARWLRDEFGAGR